MKLTSGTIRSIDEAAPFLVASSMSVVTSVRKAGSADLAAWARVAMSDHWQVSGGSSQVYWNRRSNQPRALKWAAQSACSAELVGFAPARTEVSFAPGSCVEAV